LYQGKTLTDALHDYPEIEGVVSKPPPPVITPKLSEQLAAWAGRAAGDLLDHIAR
jgi:hypothetical protein